ncbi:MAG TPA: MmgE/PrpD family protein [Burkholderiales bacterium]|jgi:2-methylcitrate dehydratase PrpD|nr:MmgE/PrpD family protein [Burkholderiales bacterium]
MSASSSSAALLATYARSQELITFLHGMSAKTVPDKVMSMARHCLLDTLGCALFGSTQPWSKILREEMAAEEARGVGSVFGTDLKLAAPAAALCNGTAVHGFELDDLVDEPIVHPGCVIIPAALATAESINASGERLLLGIIAGYEAMARLGMALGVDVAHRGFHKTTLTGPVAGAIACGVVRGLSVAQLQIAAGLGVSASCGIKSFAAGTGGGMMKRMHAGRAAESSVRMAQLAARDFSAPPSAIDGKFGLLEVYGGEDRDPDQLVKDLGRRWATDNIYVKLYPCCSWIQSAVQQLVALRGDSPVTPEQVRKVRIGVCAYAARNNGAVAPPDTMGAQYSFPYCAAVALTADPQDPEMYRSAGLDDAARRALATRVELYTDPEMEAAHPKHYGARVEVELTDGRKMQSALLDPHGMPADPCTPPEREAKFRRLAKGVISGAAADGVVAAARNAAALKSVTELTALLRA